MLAFDRENDQEVFRAFKVINTIRTKEKLAIGMPVHSSNYGKILPAPAHYNDNNKTLVSCFVPEVFYGILCLRLGCRTSTKISLRARITGTTRLDGNQDYAYKVTILVKYYLTPLVRVVPVQVHPIASTRLPVLTPQPVSCPCVLKVRYVQCHCINTDFNH